MGRRRREKKYKKGKNNERNTIEIQNNTSELYKVSSLEADTKTTITDGEKRIITKRKQIICLDFFILI